MGKLEPENPINLMVFKPMGFRLIFPRKPYVIAIVSLALEHLMVFKPWFPENFPKKTNPVICHCYHWNRLRSCYADPMALNPREAKDAGHTAVLGRLIQAAVFEKITVMGWKYSPKAAHSCTM